MTAFRRIILPDSGNELIRPELALAFEGLGHAVSRVHPDYFRLDREGNAPKINDLSVEDFFAGGPFLLLSLNFQGLNSLRQLQELVSRHNGKIAVWCVDNPWNLLSGMRDPAWTDLTIFISDDSFIPQLARHGASDVYHLPLATSPEVFSPERRGARTCPVPENLATFVFVGRSEFPGREAFFKGMSVPDSLREEAAKLVETGGRPDFFWWEERLYGKDQISFWPGKRARPPALGAEESAAGWRALCLGAAAKTGLDIFGDAGWSKVLPEGARLSGPVDYYTLLPEIYRNARFSLCLSSMQLPHGLTQRHFDVWMAGGVALTDNAAGLKLFPEELVRAVRFDLPEDIPEAAERAGVYPGGARGLTAAWREHILEKHTYRHRVKDLLRVLN